VPPQLKCDASTQNQRVRTQPPTKPEQSIYCRCRVASSLSADPWPADPSSSPCRHILEPFRKNGNTWERGRIDPAVRPVWVISRQHSATLLVHFGNGLRPCSSLWHGLALQDPNGMDHVFARRHHSIVLVAWMFVCCGGHPNQNVCEDAKIDFPRREQFCGTPSPPIRVASLLGMEYKKSKCSTKSFREYYKTKSPWRQLGCSPTNLPETKGSECLRMRSCHSARNEMTRILLPWSSWRIAQRGTHQLSCVLC